jgi:hypothetical protein
VSVLASTNSSAIERWVSLHKELERESEYITTPASVVEILLKNVSTDQKSAGVGAVVHVQHLSDSLQDTLRTKGNKPFGRAVRRHFKSLMPRGSQNYFRLDVGILGYPSEGATKCLILIHMGHLPRTH